jgi:hypothetical protein
MMREHHVEFQVPTREAGKFVTIAAELKIAENCEGGSTADIRLTYTDFPMSFPRHDWPQLLYLGLVDDLGYAAYGEWGFKAEKHMDTDEFEAFSTLMHAPVHPGGSGMLSHRTVLLIVYQAICLCAPEGIWMIARQGQGFHRLNAKMIRGLPNSSTTAIITTTTTITTINTTTTTTTATITTTT